MTYIVTCPECAFEYEMEEVEDVLDFQEEHRADRSERHILEFQMVH